MTASPPLAFRALSLAAVLLLTVASCSAKTAPPTAGPATPTAGTSPAAPSPTPSPTAEPKTHDGVKAAVDRIDQAGAQGDGATLWDMLTAAGQATMTRDDYITVIRECPKLVKGQTLSIALNAGGTSATVTGDFGPAQGGTYEWRMVYENGRWKHQPSDGAMQWMGLGATKALSVIRNQGAC